MKNRRHNSILALAATGTLAAAILAATVSRAAPPKSDGVVTLVFETLTCHKTSDLDGPDQPYLLLPGTPDPIWGDAAMKSGEKRDLRSVAGVRFRGFVLLQLWEYDTVSRNDLLGNAIIEADKAGPGVHEVRFNGDGGSYTLRYRVLH